jgi:hypothetical protein
MTTHTPIEMKKTPMKPTRNALAPTTDTTVATTVARRSSAMNLINEALSRSRMRSPQTVNSEARRSARRVAIEARHQQARELGNLSLYGVR